MTKKKTVEEVRAAFNQRGFTLVSEEYKGAHSPLNYRCSNGHQSKISFNSLRNGHGCLDCSGSKKKTFEEVEAAFNQRGFTLLSKHYQDSKAPLNYLCSNNHNATICFDNLRCGKGCSSCTGKRKKTIEEVRELFNSRGFTLLSNEYKNSKSLLNYVCDQNHNATISFDNLQSGRGCAECSFGSKRKTIEEVEANFNQRGYTLISKEYKDNKSSLYYLCDQGHRNKSSFKNLMSGQGCSSCAETGFNPNKSAILYYLKFQYEGNFYYKIGITNNTTYKRFQSEKTSYTVIKETPYQLGKDAHTQEQAILKEFARFRYKGKPFLVSGNTELFTKDVLQLDYETIQNFAA